MSRKMPSGLGERFPQLQAIGGARPVARLFVPTYRAAGSILLRRRANGLARRQLARLIEARRLSS